MRDTIDMAREVDPVTKLLLDKKLPQGMDHDVFMWFLERFEQLVRADEREEGKRWFDAVTAQHKQELLAEREACAKVCDTTPPYPFRPSIEAAHAIRARSKDEK